MRITIKDVARQANVSQATVSLVLNNAPGVSLATRDHVTRVMQDLNYNPDALARRFSSRRAEAVALIMPPTIDSLHDFYFSYLLQGVLEAVRDSGYTMLLELADARFIEQRRWEDLLTSKRVDGLIVATPFLDQAYLAELSACSYPTLLVNGARPDLPNLDFAGYDDMRCGMDATYYLIGLGHRRIGHITGPENQSSALARRQGYETALKRAQIPLRAADIVSGDYLRELAFHSVRPLLSRPAGERPTALFCANDTMALAAMEVAQLLGLSVPDELSIIGVDDTGAAERSIPALTTMRQDVHHLAHHATTLFLKNLDARKAGLLHERLPMTLIERASCAPIRKGGLDELEQNAQGIVHG